MIASEIHRRVAAVCPIVGISIVDAADPSTWVISFAPGATEQQQLDAQAIVDAFDPQAPLVPVSVTPLQARRALRAAGILAAVTAAIDLADDDTKDAWEYAIEIRRDNVALNTVATGLGMTAQDIDALFIAAAQL